MHMDYLLAFLIDAVEVFFAIWFILCMFGIC